MKHTTVKEVVENKEEDGKGDKDWEIVRKRKGKMKVGEVDKNVQNTEVEMGEGAKETLKALEEDKMEEGLGDDNSIPCTDMVRFGDQIEEIQESSKEEEQNLNFDAEGGEEEKDSDADQPEDEDPDGDDLVEVSPGTMTPKQSGKKKKGNKKSGGSHGGGKRR